MVSFAGNKQPVSFAADKQPGAIAEDRKFNESPLDQFKQMYDQIDEELPEK